MVNKVSPPDIYLTHYKPNWSYSWIMHNWSMVDFVCSYFLDASLIKSRFLETTTEWGKKLFHNKYSKLEPWSSQKPRAPIYSTCTQEQCSQHVNYVQILDNLPEKSKYSLSSLDPYLRPTFHYPYGNQVKYPSIFANMIAFRPCINYGHYNDSMLRFS